MARNQDEMRAVFLKDTAHHQMTVVLDKGVHRHLVFRQPDNSNMWFEIITWPNKLAYSGDMGTFVFSRLEDMLNFFRQSGDGPLRVNLDYWSEKLLADPKWGQEYSPEVFREQVKYQFEAAFEGDELDPDALARKARIWEAIEHEVLCHAHDGEDRAMDAACTFQFVDDEGDEDAPHAQFRLQDFWEVNCREYTFRFQWCCYALVWAIRQYDAARAAQAKAAA